LRWMHMGCHALGSVSVQFPGLPVGDRSLFG
jgi:hypothetical protein